MTAPPHDGLLADYRAPGFDDAVDPDGAVRPAARPVIDLVLEHGPAELAAAVRDEVAARGIRFASVDGDDTWHVDPVPRVIPGDEWDALAAGLAQRVRALEAFVADVYGERRIVAEGVMPARVLDTADGFEPALQGFRPRRAVDRHRRARPRARRRRDLARARGQRAHAERPRLLAGGARRDGQGARRRRPRRSRARSTGSPTRCAACSATAARSCSPTARTTPPTGSTRGSRSCSSCRSPCRPTSRCAAGASAIAATRVDTVYRRTDADRLDTRGGAAPPSGPGGRRGRPDQLLRHGRRRRQAGPRLRPRHDPLLPRRGAAARAGRDVRPRRCRRRSSARSTCSTSW